MDAKVNNLKSGVKTDTLIKIITKMKAIGMPMSKSYIMKECNVDYKSIEKIIEELKSLGRVEEIQTTSGKFFKLLG